MIMGLSYIRPVALLMACLVFASLWAGCAQTREVSQDLRREASRYSVVSYATAKDMGRGSYNVAVDTGNWIYDKILLVGEAYTAFLLWPKAYQANRDFKAQRYEMAVAAYMRLFRDHPWHWKKKKYLMQQGRALYLMRAYINAKVALDRYEAIYPDSTFSNEAMAYLRKISAIRASQLAIEEDQIAAVRGDVEQLKALIAQRPDVARLHFELGNAYWRLEEYDAAAQEYLIATELNAALRENELITKRLIIDADGNIVPMDPDREAYFARQRQPLVIFDTHEYRMTRKRLFDVGIRSYLNVTGMVRNQSERTVTNVSVEVRFKDMRGDVVDVGTYEIGAMGPGEVRAFMVQGDSGEYGYRFLTYECSAHYW